MLEPQPKVSIVLPTYNRADMIGRAIDSVIKQKLTSWELVIVDDGSTDRTSEMIKDYLSDERIKCYARPHQGVVKAINFGIGQATADIVTFLDSDDRYKSEHLAVNLDYLSQHPKIDIVHSNAEIIGSQLVPDITRPGKLIDLDECYLEGTLFIRQRVLSFVSFDAKGLLGGGYRFVQQALAAGFKIHKLASRTYVYDRSRDDSLTKQAQTNKPSSV